MCRPDSFSDQRPKVGLPSHSAPQPLLEASVMKNFLLCTVSKITPCFRQRRSLQRARADKQARVTITQLERGWNPLLQPEMDMNGHVKQTQPKYRQSRCHKAQHSLESIERLGGPFLGGSRVAQNFHGSLC